jgi:hypothetical protein
MVLLGAALVLIMIMNKHDTHTHTRTHAHAHTQYLHPLQVPITVQIRRKPRRPRGERRVKGVARVAALPVSLAPLQHVVAAAIAAAPAKQLPGTLPTGCALGQAQSRSVHNGVVVHLVGFGDCHGVFEVGAHPGDDAGVLVHHSLPHASAAGA